MNENHDTMLIAEEEIRTALRELRPDAASFEAGVRQRMELANRTAEQPRADSDSDMLRVAASVMPGPLLSLGKTSKLAGSVGNVSLGKKLLGALALPAITLVFAIGGTIAAMFLARKATAPDATADAASDPMGTMATNRWWQRHRLVAVVVFAITLLAPLLGLTIPLLFLYGLSGIAMVSLISTLAREGLVSREAICGSALPGLGLLAQLVLMIESVGNAPHLLDQSVLLAVLYVGMIVLGLLMLPSYRRVLPAATTVSGRLRKVTSRGLLVVPLLAALLITVPYLLASLWHPATPHTMQQYVENFDSAPHSSASWNDWGVPAMWLVDSGADVDWTKPRTLLMTDPVGRSEAVLVSALRAGLVQVGDIEPARLEKARYELRQAVSEFYRTRPFNRVPDFAMRAIALHVEFTDEMRDILKIRLELTFQERDVDDYHALIRCNTLVELMDVIDRPVDSAAHRDRVHNLLSKLQLATSGSGSQFAGGFASSKSLAHPDVLSTAAAIELMERFGVPDQVDILALRSYVRRRRADYAMPQQAAINTAMRLRLDSLADVPSLTWWDYVRCEQNLCLTILFTVLCIYCAAIAPSAPRAASLAKRKSN